MNFDGFKNILLEHYTKYPEMQIQDVVKLIYQNEFDGGTVKKEYVQYYRLFLFIEKLLKLNKEQLIIAIDGNSSAGKSSLANLLEGVYDCNVFHMDDFFLTPELRTEERLNEAGGNVDYLRFYNEVIKGLDSRKEFSYRRFDCRLQEFIPKGPVKSKRLNIVEGSYSMHPMLINYYDLKIFLELNEAEQKRRILARNGPEMYERFINEWIPLEEKYFREMDIKEKCDLIIST